MEEYNYEMLLDRALSRLPSTKASDSRFVIPRVKVFIEGKTTIFENFDAVCSYINRESGYVMKFLLNELGTAGKSEGTRAIFQGRFSPDDMAHQIQRFVDEYVLCWECQKPDTHIIKMDRVWVVKCDACGAIRPTMKRKGGKGKK
ncbi:translation initiation factor 2 subunit 2 [Candidatus Methanophagaceae archaeon]|nr:translation initiation factor 2 subunit 2 [Methanophagales archaeon]